MRRTILYILFLLVCVELSSRVFWRMLDRTWGFIVPQEIGRFDPDLGWSLIPSSRASSKATGQKVEYSINSLGLRGPETTVGKPEGTLRILVLGDSHTFGFGIPQDSTYPRLLQGYFKDVEVLNLGVCGYGIDQCLLRLRRDGFPLKPDVVVCYIPHFDDRRHMTKTQWGLGKPMFVEKEGRLSLENQPVANNSPWYLAMVAADSFLGKWCRTYEILRNTVYNLSLPKPKPGVMPEIDPAVVAETNRMGWLIARQMERECAERGVAFVLVTRVGELGVEAMKAGFNTQFMALPLFNSELALPHDPFRHPGVAANGVIAWEMARFLMLKGLVPQDHCTLPVEAVAATSK